MSQLMKVLLDTLDSQPPEEEAKAVKPAEGAVQAAQQKLTYKEFENLWNAISGIKHASEVDSFTLGFRLGVQVILEGLRPII